ncbi:hypothetical protein [Streptomyces nigra]|uniref:hypothetical protein n=1 Tax=Streptomyces nigra TaxID=1827580 RepID=UPI00343F24CD
MREAAPVRRTAAAALRSRRPDTVGSGPCRGLPAPPPTLGLTSAALAFVLFGVAGRSLIALAVGCNLLGYATTSGQIANQARIFAARPAIRARLNTVYIFSVFAGGAAGSAIAALSFSACRR